MRPVGDSCESEVSPGDISLHFVVTDANRNLRTALFSRQELAITMPLIAPAELHCRTPIVRGPVFGPSSKTSARESTPNRNSCQCDFSKIEHGKNAGGRGVAKLGVGSGSSVSVSRQPESVSNRMKTSKHRPQRSVIEFIVALSFRLLCPAHPSDEPPNNCHHRPTAQEPRPSTLRPRILLGQRDSLRMV